MLKRLFLVLLAMTLGLAACAGDDAGDSDASGTETNEADGGSDTGTDGDGGAGDEGATVDALIAAATDSATARSNWEFDTVYGLTSAACQASNSAEDVASSRQAAASALGLQPGDVAVGEVTATTDGNSGSVSVEFVITANDTNTTATEAWVFEDGAWHSEDCYA